MDTTLNEGNEMLPLAMNMMLWRMPHMEDTHMLELLLLLKLLQLLRGDEGNEMLPGILLPLAMDIMLRVKPFTTVGSYTSWYHILTRFENGLLPLAMKLMLELMLSLIRINMQLLLTHNHLVAALIRPLRKRAAGYF